MRRPPRNQTYPVDNPRVPDTARNLTRSPAFDAPGSRFPRFSRLLLFSRWHLLLLFVSSLFAGGLLSVYSGLDANYDLKKYHIHNVWALLNNRLDTDLFPAGLQTYFHPLLDVPYYFLALEWLPNHPRWVTFLMGIPTGFLFFLTFICIYQVLKTLHGLTPGTRLFYTGLLSFFGLSGASLVIQIGSVTNEVQVACFVLAALAAFLLLRNRPGRAALASGLLLGAGTGFKLTAVSYTLPFLLALLLFYPTWRERTRSFLAFCVAWWIAFLAIYGWWGWTLYNLTGNPFFPMYNNIFRSDWLSAASLSASWFVPERLKEAVFFPFSWVNARAVSATAATDLRFAFAYLCAAGTVLFWCLQKLTNSTFFKNKLVEKYSTHNFSPKKNIAASRYFLPSRIAKIFLLFLFLSYVLWMVLFSVLRYTIPIEALLGLVIFLCAWSILDALGIRDGKLRNLFLTTLLTTFLVVALGTTQYPHWGRLRGANTVVFDVCAPKLQENTLVLLFSPETQYLAPFIAKKNPTTTFISTGDDPLFLLEAMKDSGLHKRIQDRINEHSGPVCVVLHTGYGQFMKHLPDFGLSVSDKFYETLSTNYDNFRFYFIQKKTTSQEKNTGFKKFFIENTMTHFPMRITAKDEGHFISGWDNFRVGPHLSPGDGYRVASGEKSVIEFFSKTDSAKTLRITMQNMRIRVAIRLNGIELYSGETPGGDYVLPIPEGTLRRAGQGANILEFNWMDDRPDHIPWPLVSRPERHNPRHNKGMFESLELK